MAKTPIDIINSVKKISSEYQKHIEMAKMKHADKIMLDRIDALIKSFADRKTRMKKVGYGEVLSYNSSTGKFESDDRFKKIWEDQRKEILQFIKERDRDFNSKKILMMEDGSAQIPNYDEYQATFEKYQKIFDKQAENVISLGGMFDFRDYTSLAEKIKTDKSFMILTQKSETIDTMNTMLNNIKDEKDTLALEEYKMYVLGQGKDILSKHRDSHTSKFLNALARFLNFTPTGAKLVKSIEQHLTLFTNAIQTVQDKASETPTETHTSTPKNKD